jgi:MFS family permease
MVMAPLAGYLIEKCHAGLLGAIGLLIMACGLFGLALLPSSPSDLDIIWRMALCGAGFGLFQSPNNHTIVASAPSHRSGGASGMLGTARLLGQSTGAALVALLFNLLGNSGTHTALLLAGTWPVAALLAVCGSLSRAQPDGGKKIRSPGCGFCFQRQKTLFQIFAAAQGFNTLIQRRVSHKQLAHGFRFTVNAERHHAAGFLRLIAGFQTLQRGNHLLAPYQRAEPASAWNSR